MRLLQYIIEGASYNNDYKNIVDVMVPKIKKNHKLVQLPIIWRGWNASKRDLFYYAEVSGGDSREIIKGMMGMSPSWKGRDWVKDVVKGLGFTPICCTYSYSQAQFFGNPCVVVPEIDFKIYQNPDVSDIKVKNPGVKMVNGIHTTSYDYSDEDLQKVLDGYMEDYSNRDNEILLKCSSYYLLNVSRMLWVTKNSKFHTIKDVKEIKTYKQLLDFIYNFNSYLNYVKARRSQ